MVAGVRCKAKAQDTKVKRRSVMSGIRSYFSRIRRKMKYPNVEFDLSSYHKWLGEINVFDFSNINDSDLKNVSAELKFNIVEFAAEFGNILI